MKSSYSFKSMWPVVVLVVLLSAYGCKKSSETGGPVGGGSEGENVVQLPAASRCETEASLQNNPLCQIVLTGFSGQLMAPSNPITLQGYLKNEYFLDGKLQSTTWYASKQSTQPIMITGYNYEPQAPEPIASITIDSDTNNDGVIDQRLFTVNTYNNGKMDEITATLTALPGNNVLAKTETIYSYATVPNPKPSGWPNDSVSRESKYIVETDYSLSPTQPKVVTYEYNYLNADNRPIESRILRYENLFSTPPVPMVQKFESVETSQYDQGKLISNEKNFYDCSKGPGGSCFATADLDVAPGLLSYVKFNTTWTYTDGKLSHGLTTVDGDLFNPSGTPDGTEDYKWQCSIAYDPANKKVIAKFPEVFRFVGLSETDKIQSLSCDDFQVGKMGGNFTFDEWSYLWQATSQPEPQ